MGAKGLWTAVAQEKQSFGHFVVPHQQIWVGAKVDSEGEWPAVLAIA